MDMHAFVRELLPPTLEAQPRGVQLAKQKIRYIDATQYAIETSVKGTLVNYQVRLTRLKKSYSNKHTLRVSVSVRMVVFTHYYFVLGLEFRGPENFPRESRVD